MGRNDTCPADRAAGDWAGTPGKGAPFSEREKVVVLVQKQAGMGEGGISPIAWVPIPILQFPVMFPV